MKRGFCKIIRLCNSKYAIKFGKNYMSGAKIFTLPSKIDIFTAAVQETK